MRTAKFERVPVLAGQFAGRLHPGRAAPHAAIHLPASLHQTSQRLHQLAEAFVVADDFGPFVEKYQRYLNGAPDVRTAMSSFKLPLGTTLTLSRPGSARQCLPGTLFPPIPAIAAVAFRTGDLAAQRQRLAGKGFTIYRSRRRDHRAGRGSERPGGDIQWTGMIAVAD